MGAQDEGSEDVLDDLSGAEEVAALDVEIITKVLLYADALARPNCMETMSLEEAEGAEVIAEVGALTPTKCALESCPAEFLRGYLIRATETGNEAIVGNTCGVTKFGAGGWDRKLGDFRRRRNILTSIASMKQRQQEVAGYLSECDALCLPVRDGRNAVEAVHEYMGRIFNDDTIARLKSRGKHRDGIVSEKVALTERDRQIARETGTTSTASTRQIGIISGIAAASDYKKLEKVTKGKLQRELREFAELDVDALSPEELRKKSEWGERIRARIGNLKALHEDCVRFVGRENIRFLMDHSGLL